MIAICQLFTGLFLIICIHANPSSLRAVTTNDGSESTENMPEAPAPVQKSRNSHTSPFQEISGKAASSNQRPNLDSLLSSLGRQSQQQESSESGSGSPEVLTENLPESGEDEPKSPGLLDILGSAPSSEQKSQENSPPNNQSIAQKISSSSEESGSSSESDEDSPWSSFGGPGGMPNMPPPPVYINIPITFTGPGADHMMDMFGGGMGFGGHHGHHQMPGLGLFGLGGPPGFPLHHHNPLMNGGAGVPLPPQQMPGIAGLPAGGQQGFGGGLAGGAHPGFGGLQGLGQQQQQQQQFMPPGFVGANQPQANNMLMHPMAQQHLQNMLNQQQQQQQQQQPQ